MNRSFNVLANVSSLVCQIVRAAISSLFSFPVFVTLKRVHRDLNHLNKFGQVGICIKFACELTENSLSSQSTLFQAAVLFNTFFSEYCHSGIIFLSLQLNRFQFSSNRCQWFPHGAKFCVSFFPLFWQPLSYVSGTTSAFSSCLQNFGVVMLNVT